MKKGKMYAIIGTVAIAIGAGALFMLTEDQNQIPNSTPVAPQIPKQTSESADEWAELPVTFMDSNGHIPEVVVSQNWANGDALQACTVILEDPVIIETFDEPDLNWCIEFIKLFD